MRSNKIRVCFILHSSAKGGAERSNIELIDGLKKKDVECYAILPRDGPLIYELMKRNIPFSVLPYRWWMDRENSPFWKRIARLILNLIMTIPVAMRAKKWGADIIYTNTITVCVGALAAKLLKRPHVWHIREFGYEDHCLVFDLGSKFSLWLVDRLSTVCIVNSKALAEKYKQYIVPSKLKVVYNAVSVVSKSSFNSFQAKGGKGIRVVTVGSLHKGKRQEEAIQALAELRDIGVRAELVIVGDGDPRYRDYLCDLVMENQLEEYVEFVGWVENPSCFMQSADVVLMCSRYEAFGRVTVEAMKAGKPVIGARSGGTTELIKDGFNGLLYTPGNYRELAEKIRYFYEYPDEAKRMGENGKRWALEQFTEERYGEEILTILQQIVS